MLLDRIASIVLVFFGALLLVLLVLGLAVSCRGTGASQIATPTGIAGSVTPSDTFNTVTPFASAVPSITLPATLVAGSEATATADPFVTIDPNATILPGATADPVATIDPNVTAIPAATPDSGGATVPGATPGTGGIPGTGGMVPGATARHAVSRGEWVLQIARCYGVPASSILAANQLANPDYILPGWILTVPDIGRQGPIVGPPCVVSYTTAAGDTWDSLAARFGTSAAILQRANPGLLSVGRSIWVPRVP
ncbi:MAG: LysM peptidoglycan-binding domain-containing protein [Candidatus Promineofilum sp.]|nr:LysM peptidoglycan-binding domain-containing protein [Promineifilum sp.]